MLLSAALLLNAKMVRAQSNSLVEVKASVDKNVITIGDRVQYTLTISHDKALRIEQPGPGANLGMFEIKDYSISEPVNQGNQVVETFQYTIAVFDTGHFVIPPFPVAFFPSDTSRQYQIIKSEPIDITVKSVLTGENAELKDIKPPTPLPVDYWPYIRIALFVLVLGLLAGAAYRVYRRRKKGAPLFRKQVIRPAHEIALEQLQALRAGSLLEQGHVKTFYSELSEILKRYLENRFFISALEETTTELLDSLAELEIPGEAVAKIQYVLQLSDLVKFAKYHPDANEHQRALREAEEFIMDTRLEFETVETTEPVEL